MNRRGFLGALAALPFVSLPLVRLIAPEPKPVILLNPDPFVRVNAIFWGSGVWLPRPEERPIGRLKDFQLGTEFIHGWMSVTLWRGDAAIFRFKSHVSHEPPTSAEVVYEEI